eukprot:scaffold3620_cov121-Skeletonema_dohrnii-CCMP3373.AAC.3
MRGRSSFWASAPSLQFRWCDNSFEKMIAEKTLCGSTQTAEAHNHKSQLFVACLTYDAEAEARLRQQMKESVYSNSRARDVNNAKAKLTARRLCPVQN